MRSLVLLGAVVIATGGCGPSEGGGLHGSLGDFYDLQYADVRSRLYDDTLSIEYVRADFQVPLRVTFVDPELGRHDLDGRGDASGRVNHQVLPPFLSGTIQVTEFEAADEAPLIGSFDALFEVDDATASVTGQFNTTVEVVDDIRGYEYNRGGTP